ncbi:hypothetical protein MM239_04040 [Belliella sp. DSM 111904]|uniref:TolB-like 6-blade propeller-like n=1 Tax=Belliella filtrata TaxID=2923435 RepID=A0ABS9UWK5_9BACT|nr:hypothetical protein [Belliella filtrata]MCH7408552.1 hypothetical protein [Belliella filtrata]
MIKASLFIYILIGIFACNSVEEQLNKNVDKTLKVSKNKISGKFSKVKYNNGKFIALNQFSLEGQSLYIISENEEVWQKELIKPNTRTIIGGIPEEIFIFQDYFYLAKDNGLFAKYSYMGEVIDEISLKHILPEKYRCKTISVDKNGTCYFACSSIMETSPKEYKIIKGKIGSDKYMEIFVGRTDDNVNRLAFHVRNNELYVLMPYSNEFGVLDLNNLNYEIESFEKSINRTYQKPKEFLGSGFEYSKLSKLERAEFIADSHIQIFADKVSRNIVSQLVSSDVESPYLVQSISENKNDYFEFQTKYPVSFDSQGHIIGYSIEDDYYEFFIRPL